MSNTEHVKQIANDIETVYKGLSWYCPNCGTAHDIYNDEEDDPICPDCQEELMQMSMADYFDDSLYNIEYRVASKHDNIKSVSICIAWGGPNIWIDTKDCKVKLYWGMDYAEAEFSRGAADEITDYFNELWNCE